MAFCSPFVVEVVEFFKRIIDQEINDIIYVFKGDGTDTGMNSGLILQHGQQLLGAGIDQRIGTTLGEVTIPAQESGLPALTNANDTTGLGIQLVHGNNVVSGFRLHDVLGSFDGTIYAAPISIMNGSNYLIHNNHVETFSFGSCINVYGPGNNTSIVNNTFLSNTGYNFTDGVFFYDILSPITGSFYIANNIFKGTTDQAGLNNVIGTFGPEQPLQLSSHVDVTIVSNTFVSQLTTAGTSGSIIWAAGNGSATIVGNYMDVSQFLNPLAGVYIEQQFPTGFLSVSLENNTAITRPTVPGYDFVNSSGNPAALEINFAPSNVGTRSGP